MSLFLTEWFSNRNSSDNDKRRLKTDKDFLKDWFDAHMRMNVHISKICSKAFRGLYNIR